MTKSQDSLVNALVLGYACSERNPEKGNQDPVGATVGEIEELKILSQFEKDEKDNCEGNSKGRK